MALELLERIRKSGIDSLAEITELDLGTTEELITVEQCKELTDLIQNANQEGYCGQIKRTTLCNPVNPSEHDFRRCFDELWNAIANIKSLEEINIMKPVDEKGHHWSVLSPSGMRLSWLQRIQNRSNIRILRVDTDICISNSDSDLQQTHFIAEFVNLRELSFNNLLFTSPRFAEQEMKVFLSFLSQLKHLTHLHLRTGLFLNRPALSESCMGKLCRMGLKSLRLVNFGLTDGHLSVLTQYFPRNTTLEAIDMTGNWSLTADGYQSVLAVMEDAMYIKELHLGSVLHDATLQEALYRELSAGHDLTKRNVLLAKIESFARLNKGGRRALLRDDRSDRSDWLDLVSLVHNDLNALYWVVGQNPKIVNCNDGLSDDDGDTERARKRRNHA